jgi:hypothetical protein
MSPNPAGLSPDTPAAKARELLEAHGFHHLRAELIDRNGRSHTTQRSPSPGQPGGSITR